MKKLLAIGNVIAWSGFWAFGYIALSADGLSEMQLVTAILLAGAGMILGILAYMKICECTPTVRHISKHREEV